MAISCTNYNIVLNVLIASMCTFTSPSDSSCTPFMYKQAKMGLNVIFETNYDPLANKELITANISVI